MVFAEHLIVCLLQSCDIKNTLKSHFYVKTRFCQHVRHIVILTPLHYIGLLSMSIIKETRSVTMNIFRKKYFLFKSFVKVELSYVFTINMYSTAENCMEK